MNSSSSSEIEKICKQAKQCVRQSDNDQAIDLFKQALEIGPDSFDANNGIATVFFLTRQYEKAAEHFELAGKLDLKQGKALINLGAVFNRMGEYEKAINVLRKGLQKERDSCEGYYNMGYAQRKLNQTAMSVSAYREAIRINPEMIDAYMNLAIVYRETGNYGQAKTQYRQVLTINPEFERAKRGLEKVEQIEVEKKNEFSPFGRLVEQDGVHVDTTPQLKHELTEQERNEDRTTVHSIANEMERSAKELRSFYQDEFEPALAAITRAATEAADNPSALEESQKLFHEKLRLVDEYRKNITKLVDDLREHENSMTSSQTTTSE